MTRRVLGALLAVALAHAAVVLWASRSDQAPTGTLVPAAEGRVDELAIQFQDVFHFAQATRINLKFEHLALNFSNAAPATQFISYKKVDSCLCELAIASDGKLRK